MAVSAMEQAWGTVRSLHPTAPPVSVQVAYLVYMTEKGMMERYGHVDRMYMETVVKPRIREELHVITTKGFTEYFLILADMMQYCREHDIPIGPGRGSAGGSAVCYCLFITGFDPLEFGCIFERFLNPERIEMPDIDTDICWARRQEVIDYLVRKYGEDKVSQIITFNTLQVRGLLDDLGRVLHICKEDIAALKALIPEDPTVRFASNKDEPDKNMINNPDFMTLLNKVNEKEPRLIPAMHKLEGIHRNGSIHAGGVVIARDPIQSFAPVYYAKGQGRPVIQYEMTDAESVGALKMDALGLRTVTLIDWAEKDVRRFVDPSMYTRGYILNDQAAFDLINRGDTAGVFQLEGTGITKFAMQMHIDSFNDVVALAALYRPGPLDSGMAYEYIKRKHGQSPVSYPHPDLEPVLKDTYGIIVYQEQVMQILGVMAGYSMGRADVMRKAMGKKKKEIMDEQIALFKEAALARGYDQHTVDTVADLISTFARYGFNKSHAVAYAFLCYWTAVLKARFPAAFYAAWLNVTDDGERQGWIIDQATRIGVQVLPPDVNQSQAKFAMVDPNTIRFGLAAVKGMGDSFVSRVMASREHDGPFTSYLDFCRRIPSVPINVKEAMIAGGAFDFDRSTHRRWLFETARLMNDDIKKGAEWQALREKHPDIVPYSDMEMAELEKQYVNFYITANPITLVQAELRLIGAQVGVPVEDMRGTPLVGGTIKRKHTVKTKAKGQTMAFIEVDDGIRMHEVTIFPDLYKRCAFVLNDGQSVLMACTIGQYKGKPTLQADRLEVLDIKSRRGTMIIDLGTRTDVMTLAQLRHIIDNARPGRVSIDLRVANDEYRFSLRSGIYQIDATDDIMGKIRGLLGPDCIGFAR